MLPLSSFEMVDPSNASPGTFLFKCAHYSRPPLLICNSEEDLQGVAFADDPLDFVVNALPRRPGAYFRAIDYRVSVDWAASISPKRDQIPNGTLCLREEGAFIAAQYHYDQVLVGFDGTLIEREGENFVGFPGWKIDIAIGDGRWQTIYSRGIDS